MLLTKGVVSGPEMDRYRARDAYLEQATWIGVFVSVALLLGVVALKVIGSVSG